MHATGETADEPLPTAKRIRLFPFSKDQRFNILFTLGAVFLIVTFGALLFVVAVGMVLWQRVRTSPDRDPVLSE